MGEVLALGETAYGDEEKFPGGPWCQVGDTVLMREYSGTRFKIDGVEYRLINDDTIEAVVTRPELVTRAV
jgi:chaperonin GroES